MNIEKAKKYAKALQDEKICGPINRQVGLILEEYTKALAEPEEPKWVRDDEVREFVYNLRSRAYVWGRRYCGV